MDMMIPIVTHSSLGVKFVEKIVNIYLVAN